MIIQVSSILVESIGINTGNEPLDALRSDKCCRMDWAESLSLTEYSTVLAVWHKASCHRLCWATMKIWKVMNMIRMGFHFILFLYDKALTDTVRG